MCIEKKSFSDNFFIFLSSIITAIGIGALYYYGAISNISVMFYITLILGIIGIIYCFITFFCGNRKDFFCLSNVHLIPSSIGAIVTSIFALTSLTLSINALSIGYFIVSVAFFMMFSLINFIEILFCVIYTDKCPND